MSNQVTFWLLIAMVVFQIWLSYRSFKKRGFKGLVFSTKEWIESLKISFFMILSLYAIIGGFILVEPLQNWITEQITNPDTSTRAWVYQGMMVSWIIGVIYVYYSILRKSCKPLFEYTDQEKKWQDEDRRNSKIRQWLKAKFPRLIKDNENTKTS